MNVFNKNSIDIKLNIIHPFLKIHMIDNDNRWKELHWLFRVHKYVKLELTINNVIYL